jgi:hypothetical protein
MDLDRVRAASRGYLDVQEVEDRAQQRKHALVRCFLHAERKGERVAVRYGAAKGGGFRTRADSLGQLGGKGACVAEIDADARTRAALHGDGAAVSAVMCDAACEPLRPDGLSHRTGENVYPPVPKRRERAACAGAPYGKLASPARDCPRYVSELCPVSSGARSVDSFNAEGGARGQRAASACRQRFELFVVPRIGGQAWL